MTNKTQPTISDAEWEIMRVVWTNHTVTSKDITEIIKEKMNWKQATIKTLIGRLVEKGMLKTEAIGNKYLYSPSVTEEESLKSKTSDFFEHLCNRKVGATLAELLSEATLSHSDVQLLEEIIQRKKMEAVDVVSCNCTPGQCDCQHYHH
ncbi:MULTISPECIES: CopY/TcrY family copper transport repressor [Carnobacterium]|uniref:Uracil phosphoribosyltransferase n=2 Tax=Carnobacterium inhibens TaxID=147709 RepID=U5SDV1_9LACT|nr:MULTISPECIES: CopY/TcrY family copper transport repressor [Carnobacterium]AGY82278.1 uracil phosphoribosyltransferase [Carnobacterium inhibens subsp. gilichinskyi]MBC9824421.1 CopY/TcrY family copper transport repressor [Carnobacterium inhibens]MCM3511794.1 CopY/TcrY family copper transport repressor [Carnobacterium inhibens]MDN5372059.1 hypothetical protein [Carnobacterium sp.]